MIPSSPKASAGMSVKVFNVMDSFCASSCSRFAQRLSLIYIPCQRKMFDAILEYRIWVYARRRNPELLIFNAVGNGAISLQMLMHDAENLHLVNDTSLISQLKLFEKIVEPLCRKITGGADYCETEGDIRIQADSNTIFVVTPDKSISNTTNSWIIQPYPRKNIASVNNWKVKLVGNNDEEGNVPKCTHIHSNPGILFSTGGYSGNQFHDFADLIFPLYVTSFRFQKKVHFLASDFRPWWISKYKEIINRLTRHAIVNIDEEKGQVHCYPKMTIGLKFYKELLENQSQSEYSEGPSMYNFRKLIKETYLLERKHAMELSYKVKKGPRLMIIARKRTRVLINEGEVTQLAKELGFEVILAEPSISANMTMFAQLVNSCDALMGVHGAGLTNMLFLPDKAVLIQLVPYGKIELFARLDFGNPAAGMNIRYLEYSIVMKESSLSREYPIDHPVLRDPMSLHKKGFAVMSSIYLKNQNVTVDVLRFKGTLVKALQILRH